MKRIVSGIVLFLLLLSTLTLVFNVEPVKSEPTKIVVPEDYPTIQEAINAADEGDTIFVKTGTYYEHLIINKSLSLMGENRSTTIIDGGGTGIVVNVTASNVTINGFMIRNSGRYIYPLCAGLYIVHSIGSVINGNIIAENQAYGIFLESCDHTTVEDNIIVSNRYDGIVLSVSYENEIRKNLIVNNWAGVSDGGASNKIIHNTITSNVRGITLGSYRTEINGNTIANNTYDGIYLRGSSVLIHSNTIIGNRDGIYFDAAKYNNISHNIIALNYESGIKIEQASPGNIFRHNNLTGNGWNFGVFAGYTYDFVQDIDSSNTVDGKPICYWVNERDKQVPADAGYVAAINCVNVTVKDINVRNNLQGMLFAGTTNSTIENIYVSDCWIGIQLFLGSSQNIIRNNTVTNNERRGIELFLGCKQNTISENTITSNMPIHVSPYAKPWYFMFTLSSGVGVSIDGVSEQNIVQGNTIAYNEIGILAHSPGLALYGSNNNTIIHNILINNIKQARSVRSTNIWDDGYPSGGNYWSDHVDVDFFSGQYQNVTGSDGIGDELYVIDVNNVDRYPLMTPWAPPTQHELVVALKAPIFLWPGQPSLLNATIANRGLNNETNIAFLLLINGTVAESTTIPFLHINSRYTFSYNWTPIKEGVYNVTLYTSALPEEENIMNNQFTVFVRVRGLTVPEDFATIQDAINVAYPGETILVRAGIYRENIVIVKLGLSLVGENPTTTVIDAHGATGIKITASGVTVANFTIPNGDCGIELVEADGCIITRNIVTNNNEGGVVLSGSSNNIISENNVTDNGDWGIDLVHYSDNNTVIGNNVTKNTHGIRLRASWYNTLNANTVTNNSGKGLHMETASQNILRDNILAGNKYNFGVFTFYDEVRLSTYTQDIDTSNTVDGKPIYYLINQNGLIIDSSDIGYLALVNCTNIHIKNVTLTNNGQGLLLAFTTNSTIENATIVDNGVGIHALSSDANTITASNITNNDSGVSLYRASFNNITENILTNNGISIGTLIMGWGYLSTTKSIPSEDNVISSNTMSNGGIGLSNPGTTRTIVTKNTIKNGNIGISLGWGASNNKIYHNNFIDNKKQVYIDKEYGASVNVWDDGYPSGGNYWSDYVGVDVKSGPNQDLPGSDRIGDTPYTIDENNQDNYPFMNPYVLLGDLNDDGVVNVLDMAIFGKAFGSYPGYPRWNSAADVNGDGKVNILDGVLIARNFGKKS